MWKDYSVGFIKKNRASSISIMAAALIASLFLSFLCSMFYNLWVYEVEKIILEEGDWQGRIAGDIGEEDILTIQSFANVEKVAVNEALSGEQGTVVDVYFQNARTIFQDMPLITEKLGLDEDAATCHLLLLSKYLIHDPQDETPPLLLTFYLFILLAVSCSLILIIHNSFAVTMNARVHQFGILSSIGATPGQIRACLMQEAAALCIIPILSGNLLGIAVSYGTKSGIEMIAADMPGRFDMRFQYHPAVLALTLFLSVLTVLVSAWLPASRLSRLTPLEAVKRTGGPELKRRRHSRILAFLFGIEGELAGNALKAQRKALRTSTISLILSFLGFTMMLCLFALTDLSTRYTYFERYQDVWDVMAAVKDTDIEEFFSDREVRADGEVRGIEGVRDCVVYQKAEAVSLVTEDMISDELRSVGGPEAFDGALAVPLGDLQQEKATRLLKAPIVIMDDAGFLDFCGQAGLEPRLDGTIIRNLFWDSKNSNFRHRAYIPFLKENQESIILQNAEGNSGGIKIPVLGFTEKAPALKEEYADYGLVQFMPLSLWRQIGGTIAGAEEDTLIRILAGEGVTLPELSRLEERLVQLVGSAFQVESENRIEDKITNDRIISGYKLAAGAFCTLLALIGIANVFSYTLGFISQRRREFARYMSVGMTPAGIRKMFCVEAFVIAGRPLLVTFPLTYLFVVFTAKASFLEPAEVWPEIPFGTIALFSLMITGFVALAYCIGGRRVLRCSLAEALRDDTME